MRNGKLCCFYARAHTHTFATLRERHCTKFGNHWSIVITRRLYELCSHVTTWKKLQGNNIWIQSFR